MDQGPQHNAHMPICPHLHTATVTSPLHLNSGAFPPPTPTHTHRTRDIAGDDEAFEVKEAFKIACTKDHVHDASCGFGASAGQPRRPANRRGMGRA